MSSITNAEIRIALAMTPLPASTNSDGNADVLVPVTSDFSNCGEDEAVVEEVEEEEEEEEEEDEEEEEVEPEEDVEEEEPEEEEEIVEEKRVGEEDDDFCNNERMLEEGDEVGKEDNGVEEMDISNSPMGGDANEKDLSASMETNGHERLMRSRSCNPHKSEFHGSSNHVADGNNNGALKFPCSFDKSLRNDEQQLPEETNSLESRKFLITTKNEVREGYVVNKKDGENQSEENNSVELDKFNHASKHLGSSEIMEAKTISLSTLTRKRVAVSNHNFDETNDVLNLDEDVQQSAKQPTHDNSPMALRLVTTENKRPAAICDFFAKGWCVRGSLCKFLHIQDHVGSSGQQTEGGGEKQVPLKEERVSPWRDGDSQRQSQLSEKHISLHRIENMSLGILSDSQHSLSTKVDPGLVSSFNEVGKHNVTKGGSIFNDKLFLDCRLSSSGCLPTSAMLLSNHHSSGAGSSLPFSYSSLNATSLDVRKLPMENDYGASTSASLLRNSSPFSISESDNFSLMNASYHSIEWKKQVLSYDWVPSVPFRPSFIVSPLTTSSPGRQYDPLRDSIELPRIGNDPCHQGTSTINNLRSLLASDSKVCKTIGSEREGDTSSLSSHNKNMENKMEKASHKHGKDSLVAEAEPLGSSSVVDEHNGSVPGDTDIMRPLDHREITEIKIRDTSDSRHQGGNSSSKKDLKSDGYRQSSEMDSNHRVEGKMNKKSKASRYFRVALVDLVKEFLKPTWHERRLSKDAHNMIVKKATDKVIGTLQPHQIPATTDLIKQYLALSGPKIEKLVEGYVEKYGKS